MKIQTTAQAGSRFGLLLLMLSASLWGTVGVFVHALYQLTAANSLSIGFFRLAISVPVLGIACRLTLRNRIMPIAKRHLWLMLLIGVMTALYQVCYFTAIAQIGVAAATLITLCTAPISVALLASVLLGERLTTGVLLSGLAALIGTILLIQPAAETHSLQSWIGVLFALGSALGYAIVILCSRVLAGRYHPLQTLTVGFSTGALVLLPFAIATEFTLLYSGLGWGLLLYLGIIPTALAYLLYFSGIRHTTATVASIVTLLEPLISTVLAWWLLGERLGSLGLVGAAIMLGAIAILYGEVKSS
jgi:drug/metabolite transporter, DME family